jgi:hypothetical protein
LIITKKFYILGIGLVICWIKISIFSIRKRDKQFVGNIFTGTVGTREYLHSHRASSPHVRAVDA